MAPRVARTFASSTAAETCTTHARQLSVRLPVVERDWDPLSSARQRGYSKVVRTSVADALRRVSAPPSPPPQTFSKGGTLFGAIYKKAPCLRQVCGRSVQGRGAGAGRTVLPLRRSLTHRRRVMAMLRCQEPGCTTKAIGSREKCAAHSGARSNPKPTPRETTLNRNSTLRLTEPTRRQVLRGGGMQQAPARPGDALRAARRADGGRGEAARAGGGHGGGDCDCGASARGGEDGRRRPDDAVAER